MKTKLIIALAIVLAFTAGWFAQPIIAARTVKPVAAAPFADLDPAQATIARQIAPFRPDLTTEQVGVMAAAAQYHYLNVYSDTITTKPDKWVITRDGENEWSVYIHEFTTTGTRPHSYKVINQNGRLDAMSMTAYFHERQ